jgi:Asp/Glu/hydantoin racemase
MQSDGRRTLGLIHASPAAIAPVVRYYRQHAAEFVLVNLLDDGILAYFSRQERSSAQRRIADLVRTACQEYHAAAVIVTCSSAEAEDLSCLQRELDIPVLKIDEPMARRATSAGRRIFALATFEPTVETTRRLLLDHGAAEVRVHVVPDAYAALLNANPAEHDRLVIESLPGAVGFDCIVLAQVSMAHLREEAQRRSGIPVFSSLETSLEAIRSALSLTA